MNYPDWYIREINAIRKSNEAWLKRTRYTEEIERKQTQSVVMKRRQPSYCPASMEELQQIMG